MKAVVSFRGWLKHFFVNFGTIFAGLVGSLISGVLPTFYSQFNPRLGYEITAIISLIIGSYLSYHKVASRAVNLEEELTRLRTSRRCEIKLLKIGHQRNKSTILDTELLTIDATIHIRNGDVPTSIILKSIDLIPVPDAKFSLQPCWKKNHGVPARILNLAEGQQFVDTLHCVFLVPTNKFGSSLGVEYVFDESYQGTIVIKGNLSFPAIAFA